MNTATTRRSLLLLLLLVRVAEARFRWCLVLSSIKIRAVLSKHGESASMSVAVGDPLRVDRAHGFEQPRDRTMVCEHSVILFW